MPGEDTRGTIDGRASISGVYHLTHGKIPENWGEQMPALRAVWDLLEEAFAFRGWAISIHRGPHDDRIEGPPDAVSHVERVAEAVRAGVEAAGGDPQGARARLVANGVVPAR